MLTRIQSVITHRPGIRTVKLYADALRYKAGQYVIVRKNLEEQGKCFSFSSSPTEKYASITIKQSPECIEDIYSAGEEMHISDPLGTFTLPNDKTIPIIFVAGGMGIAPVRSLVKCLIDTEDFRPITVFYSVKRVEDMLFLSLLKDYPLTLNTTITGTVGSSKDKRMSADVICQLAKAKSALVYLSGPKHMVQAIGVGLSENGIKRSSIIADLPIAWGES